MKKVKIEEWREYFTGEIQTRYGVDREDARRSAEDLLESLFGDQKLDDTKAVAKRPMLRAPDIRHLQSILEAAHDELTELIRHSGSGAADFADRLRRESDWLRAAQANLRQFIWDRPGSDSFAKRRSV
jgi:hypothetical protein